MKKVCVLGLGYIGLPTAAMFATHGFEVLGVDVNPRIVEALNGGQMPIQEPGLKALAMAAIRSGNLKVAEKPEPSDAFIIAVPTPLAKGARELPFHTGDGRRAEEHAVHRADLTYVVSAAASILGCLRPGNLVVLESTVPPCTTADVLAPVLRGSGIAIVDERNGSGPKDGEAIQPSGIYVAHCPERVLPGRILEELVQNDRVIGGIGTNSAEVARTFYSSFVKGNIFLTDATTAEMVKLMENTYRDVNIALANQFAGIAERVGIDVWQAIGLANRHPRVNILTPGPGVGGHCIAVDPWFLIQGMPGAAPLISTAREVNDAQPYRVVEMIQHAVADLEDPTIAVLGLAYKPDVDDLRESPSLRIHRLLSEYGYRVRVHDACARSLPDGTPFQPDLHLVLSGADLLVLLTDHMQYRQLTPSDEGPASMGHRRVVDARNCLDTALWEEAGFSVGRLGAARQEQEAPVGHAFAGSGRTTWGEENGATSLASKRQ